jgi:hypothetical protein
MMLAAGSAHLLLVPFANHVHKVGKCVFASPLIRGVDT